MPPNFEPQPGRYQPSSGLSKFEQAREQRPQQAHEWQPIAGIDTSVWQYDPMRNKNILRRDHEGLGQDGPHNRLNEPLLFHKNFDVQKNNEMAEDQLRRLLNSSVQSIHQLSVRTRFFVLRHQFMILLENYESCFAEVVQFANQHCMVQFEPETRYFEDLPDPILRILQSQKATKHVVPSQLTTVKMSVFVEAVLK